MRTNTYDRVTRAEADEMLTTGEAASLLNASRQHVVDLCERGDLPFTTVGAHRRVRRGDVERLRTRSDRLTRDQQRSLWLAYATAGKITQAPHIARQIARKNLENMQQASRGQARRWLMDWERLLAGPTEELLRVLVSPSPKNRELRQNSPLAGILTQEERDQVLLAWQNERAQGVAGREKDMEFATALIQSQLVSVDTLRERTARLKLPGGVIQRVNRAIDACMTLAAQNGATVTLMRRSTDTMSHWIPDRGREGRINSASHLRHPELDSGSSKTKPSAQPTPHLFSHPM